MFSLLSNKHFILYIGTHMKLLCNLKSSNAKVFDVPVPSVNHNNGRGMLTWEVFPHEQNKLLIFINFEWERNIDARMYQIITILT